MVNTMAMPMLNDVDRRVDFQGPGYVPSLTFLQCFLSIYIPLYTGNPYTGTLANSEDTDEMQLNAAFHQGLHCLLSLKQPSGTEIYHNIETATCDPINCKMGNSIAQIAQLVKHPLSEREVVGSNPVAAPYQKMVLVAPLLTLA